MTLLADLIRRLGSAKEPDYRLDVDIAVACPYRWPRRRSTAPGKYVTTYEDGRTGVSRALDYTGSIDAAMRLMPDGYFLGGLSQVSPHDWIALVCSRSDSKAQSEGEAGTAAVAVCIATLKARQHANGEKGDQQ